MTPAQREQIEQCKRALAHGANAQDLRDLGFAEGAIQAAMRAARREEQAE